MIDNKRVLVIKLSPVKGLNSSMMRAIAAIKGLLSKGFKVDLLTLQTCAIHVVNKNEYDFMNEVNVVYANPNKAYSSIVSGSNSGIKKIVVEILRKIYHTFSLFDYSGSIAKKIKISILPSAEYEYVLAVSDPKSSHLATKTLINQGLKYNKLIQYWGDPLTGDITLKSIYPKFVYRNVEERLLSIADKIVYTSPLTLKEEQRIHPRLKNRMISTPTAYIEEKILPPREGKYTVGYYGAYPSNVRNILPLYEACKRMNSSIDLKIVGNSDIVLEKKSNIEILPRGDISSFELITDLFICILNRSGTQIPGKLYHYAAYNRPILVIEDGEYASEIHKYVASFDRYYTCKNDVDSIKKSIIEIMNYDKVWLPYEKMSSDHVIDTILE